MSDFSNYGDNGFNGGDNNGSGKKPPSKQAIIITVIAIAAGVLMMWGMSAHNFGVAVMGFCMVFIVTFVGIVIKSKSNGTNSSVSTRVSTTQFTKYLPLLNDERTKQHPEVQVLLQYTEVQRAFFDPSSLSNSTTANDEHVQELFRVFDEILAQGGLNGNIYGNLPNQAQNGAMPSDPFQKSQMDSFEKKKPIRKVGKIMRWIGIGIFILPFGLVFTLASLNPGSSLATAAVSFVVTGACPMGMLLIIVGTILGR